MLFTQPRDAALILVSIHDAFRILFLPMSRLLQKAMRMLIGHRLSPFELLIKEGLRAGKLYIKIYY